MALGLGLGADVQVPLKRALACGHDLDAALAPDPFDERVLCLLGSSRTVWRRTAVPLANSSPNLTQRLGNMSSGMWFSLVMKMFEPSG